MRRVYFFAAILLLFVSCNKANDDIDLSVLNSHDFIDCYVNEYQNNIYKENNDTVRLSFERKDTLKLYYFNYGNGVVLTKIDTGYMKYRIVNGNEVAFGWFLDKYFPGVNYAISLHWYIEVLNSDTLIINSYSESGEMISHFGYKPIKK